MAVPLREETQVVHVLKSGVTVRATKLSIIQLHGAWQGAYAPTCSPSHVPSLCLTANAGPPHPAPTARSPTPQLTAGRCSFGHESHCPPEPVHGGYDSPKNQNYPCDGGAPKKPHEGTCYEQAANTTCPGQVGCRNTVRSMAKTIAKVAPRVFSICLSRKSTFSSFPDVPCSENRQVTRLAHQTQNTRAAIPRL